MNAMPTELLNIYIERAFTNEVGIYVGVTYKDE
jgi:hypothetical protein